MSSPILSNKASDARIALGALIEARSLSIREDDPAYPKAVAKVAWAIADAMSEEHLERTGKRGDGR
jgi:hypothetical protein